MKIIARVPVREVRTARGFTHECESMEVVVLRLKRVQTGANTKRYYYHADIFPPREFLELCKISSSNFLLKKDDIIGKYYSVHINRKTNKKWMPPKKNWENDIILVEDL